MPVTEDDIEAAIAARDAVLRSAKTPYEVDHREAMRAALEAAMASTDRTLGDQNAKTGDDG